MKWIVATNLRDDCRGALEFVAWMHANARDRGSHVTTSVAILRDGAGMLDGGDVMRDRVEHATREFVAASPARDIIEGVRVDVGPDVAKALSSAAEELQAGLILGRAAPRENNRLVRLGAVARRTLRALPGPVVIVPPDWTAEIAGVGPIVVAVDASPSSLAALDFAERLATSMGRPMLAVQAVQGLSGLGTAFMTSADLVESRAAHQQRDVEALQAFFAEHGRAALDIRAEVGPTLSTLLEVADDVHAAAIVCGSRRLTFAERLFSASVGSDLAAFAEIPVAVVPPTD